MIGSARCCLKHATNLTVDELDMHRERTLGLNEGHERRLLASARYAGKLIRECDEVLAASEHPQVLSPSLSPPDR